MDGFRVSHHSESVGHGQSPCELYCAPAGSKRDAGLVVEPDQPGVGRMAPQSPLGPSVGAIQASAGHTDYPSVNAGRKRRLRDLLGMSDC